MLPEHTVTKPRTAKRTAPATALQPTFVYVPPETVWPTDGKRLAEVASPYGFLPVTEEILAEITRRIVETLQPDKVILFGSYAYGKPNPDSDVDLFVVMETGLPPAQRSLAVCRLIRPRPFPVDILVKTPAELAAALARQDWFIAEILTQGKVLYERPCKPT